jgi:ABC-type transport system substrate-binding protein
MWDRAVYSPDRQDRIDAVMEWQTWYYNNVPASIMRQETMLFAFAPEISGFDVLLQGYYFQNMTHSNPAVTEVTYTIPGEFDDYNPLISNSYYDFCALSNCHYSLSSRRGVYNISHPVPTPITEYWNVSADQLTWDVKLTEGLFFSNGNKFNASDVVFSYQAPFDENIGSSSRATVLTVFQNASNIVAVDEYHVRFTLPEFYPFMSSIGLGLSILDKEEMEGYNINASEWSTHASNTEYTPAGLGPYIMTDIDPTGYGCKLIPNPYHIGYEDAAAVGGGIYWQNATLNVSLDIEKSPFTAWTNLKNDAIHGIDANTGLQALASDIIASPDGVLVTVLEYGWQELVYNHFSPVWGNNPADPTEMYPEDYVVETTEVVISTVISGTTYYETVIQTVVQSPGFGVLVFLGGSISLAYLFRKKRR